MKCYHLTLLTFLFSACTKKEKTLLPIAPEKTVYEKYQWEPVIDSLANNSFQGIEVGDGNKVFVNVWKIPNPDGSYKNPATLISYDNGATWKWVDSTSGLPQSWTYLRTHKNALLAGTPDRGLFRSLNNGVSWQPFQTNNWIWPENIQSGSGRLFISDFRLEKAYISDDDGQNWRMVFPQHLRTVSLQPNGILALQRGQVLQSSDWGQSWKTDPSLNDQLGEVPGSLGILQQSDTIVAAVTLGVFYKKTSTGMAWQKISMPIKNDLSLFFADKNLMVVQEAFTNTLQYSVDFGKTWRYFGTGKVQGRLWNMVRSGKYLYTAGESGFFRKQIE